MGWVKNETPPTPCCYCRPQLAPPSRCSVPGVHSDMCIVRVRRSHLVEDALEEVGRQTRSDLLKPLRCGTVKRACSVCARVCVFGDVSCGSTACAGLCLFFFVLREKG